MTMTIKSSKSSILRAPYTDDKLASAKISVAWHVNTAYFDCGIQTKIWSLNKKIVKPIMDSG